MFEKFFGNLLDLKNKLENFFDFFGNFSVEFFGGIFLAQFFWHNFLGGFFGDEFFAYIAIDLFVNILTKTGLTFSHFVNDK